MKEIKGIRLSSAAEWGKLVRATRKEQGISQEQLAGVANVGVRFISDLENGKKTLQLDKAILVLEALGLGAYAFNRWEMK
jgi:y4mF family transcriptional regulator